MIYNSVDELLANHMWVGGMVFTSGPFHLIHRGHIQLLLESAKLAGRGGLIVAVNGDGFLMRKHGYVGVPLEDRLAIVDAIQGVSAVFPWDDETQTVAGAIRKLSPVVFTKGGDRSGPEYMQEDELLACKEVGCEIRYGVGGYGKLNSSSLIAARIAAGYHP